MTNFVVSIDDDGILTAALDVQNRTMNTITEAVIAELGELIDRVIQEEAVKGLVLCSAKDTGFCAGADLGEVRSDELIGLDKASATRAELQRISALSSLYRRLETCGKPVAAAINGLALGGGLELALAAHYRIATDDSRTQLGLPEINIGLMPGAGGTQRLARLLGLPNALRMLMLGRSVDVSKALQIGLVNEIVPFGSEIVCAKKWLLADGTAVQPWDRKGYVPRECDPYDGSGALTLATAEYRKTTAGNFENGVNLLKAVYEGLLVPMDTALMIESRYMLLTLRSRQAKAIVRSQYKSLQELKKGAGRPSGVQASKFSRIGVVGAGMMGAGISLVAAQAGVEVQIIDRDFTTAEKGKSWAQDQLAKSVAKGRISSSQAEAILARIHPASDFSDLDRADLVIEAVFEDRSVKADVIGAISKILPDSAIFASNTSSIPITQLAKNFRQPANFVGMHFFSPVDRMPLVEVIKGKETNEITLARAIDFALKLRKTPIIVSDARGFYTSRTFGTYLIEGFELLDEGFAPAIIDNVGRAIGMPRGPLELSDDVGLDLCLASRKQARADLGDSFIETAQDRLLPILVEKMGRIGRKKGKGLYDYAAGDGAKRIWSELAKVVPIRIAVPSQQQIQDVRDRLLYCQAVEASRAFAEGVVDDPRTADVGALLGWGFPIWTGGPLSLIDQVGTSAFVQRCDEIVAQSGNRFCPPESLREMSRQNATYY